MSRVTVLGHKKLKSSVFRALTESGAAEITESALFDGLHNSKASDSQEIFTQKKDKIAFELSFLKRIKQLQPYLVPSGKLETILKTVKIKPYAENESKISANFGRENLLLPYGEITEILKEEERLFKIISDCFEINTALTDNKSAKAKIKGLLAELQPYAECDVKFSETRATKHTEFVFGTVEIKDEETFWTSVEYADSVPGTEEHIFTLFSATGEKARRRAVFTAVLKQDYEAAKAKLAEYSFLPCTFTEEKTGAELIEFYKQTLASLDAQEEALYERVKPYFVEIPSFKRLYDYYLIETEKSEAGLFGVESRDTFTVDAWVPEAVCGAVVSNLNAVGSELVVITRSPEENEIPPSLVKNGTFVGAFGKNVTAMFGAHEYGGLDPNPVVSFFYCLFFGFMFSDAAYGVILTLFAFGYILIKKPVNKSFFLMFGFCGISTVLWGTIFGSWFGENLFKFQPLDTLSADGILIAFGLALGLGVVHLAAAYAMSVAAKLHRGVKSDLPGVFNDGGWMFVLIGIIPFVFGMLFKSSLLDLIGKIVMLVGAAGLVLGGAWGKKNPLKMFLGVLKAPYNAISVFSDILSYSRIFCLALTTGIIGMVINIIAGVLFDLIPVIGYVVGVGLLVIGHAMNFGINALGCYVHDSRLQFVEFFGKFFDGSGRAFKPLGSAVKYHYLTSLKK
jgi:V/A-type H+-transporting ATPase subunit I